MPRVVETTPFQILRHKLDDGTATISGLTMTARAVALITGDGTLQHPLDVRERPQLPELDPQTPDWLERGGYRIHLGREDDELFGRYWWTFHRDGMDGIDAPTRSWETAEGAIADASLDYAKELLGHVHQCIRMTDPDDISFRDSGADVIAALCEQDEAIREWVEGTGADGGPPNTGRVIMPELPSLDLGGRP